MQQSALLQVLGPSGLAQLGDLSNQLTDDRRGGLLPPWLVLADAAVGLTWCVLRILAASAPPLRWRPPSSASPNAFPPVRLGWLVCSFVCREGLSFPERRWCRPVLACQRPFFSVGVPCSGCTNGIFLSTSALVFASRFRAC